MGMYDHLKISDERYQDLTFQIKDFENQFDRYEVTIEGRLVLTADSHLLDAAEEVLAAPIDMEFHGDLIARADAHALRLRFTEGQLRAIEAIER